MVEMTKISNLTRTIRRTRKDKNNPINPQNRNGYDIPEDYKLLNGETFL
jgi:hypothetical protein